jgi:hypothetical protein
MTRGQPATKELALRAVSTEPVRGNLPIRPAADDDLKTADGASAGGGRTPNVRDRKGDTLLVRNPTDPSRVLVDRKTGASERKPGIALDEELRRGRIYNNREPRKVDRLGDTTGGGGSNNAVGERVNGKNAEGRIVDDNGERKTGAVARPTRPIRNPDGATSVEGGSTTTNGSPAMKRPVREVDPEGETVRPRPSVSGGDGGERPERKVRPVERPSDDAGTTTATPDYRRERPTVREERAKPAERSAPDVYRPRPEVREERKTQREERPEPRYERPAPAREERSAPREERSAPREERSSPPPPKEERSAPAPAREERRADPPPRDTPVHVPRSGKDRPRD